MLLKLDNAPVPAANTPAPDFTLPSALGHKVTLSSFRGSKPVLLAFFPLAFTGTCTDELCAMTEDFARFEASGAEILPISVDSTATLREYRKQYNLAVDLLSDFRRTTSAAYGVLNEERFYSQRAYFAIDREGVVRWSHVEARNGERRSNDEILAALQPLGAR